MMREAATGAFEAVVFYDLDQFGRHTHQTMVALNALADLGVWRLCFQTPVIFLKSARAVDGRRASAIRISLAFRQARSRQTTPRPSRTQHIIGHARDHFAAFVWLRVDRRSIANHNDERVVVGIGAVEVGVPVGSGLGLAAMGSLIIPCVRSNLSVLVSCP
jgi:hypothetical protein